jgi:hypothetical protein
MPTTVIFKGEDYTPTIPAVVPPGNNVFSSDSDYINCEHFLSLHHILQNKYK